MTNYRKLFSILRFLLLVGFLNYALSCSVGDSTPPSQITDLRISANGKNFEWTAPGDDGDSGQATLYLLRFYTEQQVAEILGVPSLDGIPFSQIQPGSPVSTAPGSRFFRRYFYIKD